MKRRFLYLEANDGTQDGSIMFRTVRHLLEAQLKKAEMVMEEFTDPQEALATVLANPEDAWLILTCYDVKEDVHAMSLIRGVRERKAPSINAYIVLFSGFEPVSVETAESLGANKSVFKHESLPIPLDREFHRFINFVIQLRRNSRTDFSPPTER
jgi:hypothetical protein